MRIGIVAGALFVAVGGAAALAGLFLMPDSQETSGGAATENLTVLPARKDVPVAVMREVAEPPPSTTTEIPRPMRAKIDDILQKFDQIWAAPKRYSGQAYFDAIRERDIEVEDLAEELAGLGEEIVPEVRIRLGEAGMTYERKMLLARGLSVLGSEGGLRVLGQEVRKGADWRWRDFAFQRLVESEGEKAPDVGLSILPHLRDPRFLLPVLRSGWDPDRVEQAYRVWLGNSDQQTRSRSYDYISKHEGGWIGDLLKEVAAARGRPGRERAAAIVALSSRKDEGLLWFFRDLLWTEENITVIQSLAAAIRRIGGEEGREILAEYAAGPVPENARDLVESIARQPDRQAVPPETGEGGQRRLRVRAERVNPERVRRGYDE